MAADEDAVAEAVASLAGDMFASMRFDSISGKLLVTSIERDIEPGPDLTDSAQMLAAVGNVLGAAGASGDQIQFEASTLRAVGGDIGQEPTKHDIAKTLQFGRRLLGLNVAHEGGAASFGMDGEFIVMRSQWRRIDYTNSVLAVEGSETETDVMTAAAQMLAERGVELRPSVYAIDVSVYYTPREAASSETNLWALDLLGVARLRDSNGNGRGGEGEIPSYEFYLDGGGPLLPDVE
jgi:hypothetical protein